MARVTFGQVEKKLKSHGDDEVKEIGLSGRVPAEVLHELLASHIPKDASDFNFGYVGRGRSKSDVLMLIVTRGDRVTRSVVKCGPVEEIAVETKNWKLVKHLPKNLYPTRKQGQRVLNQFTSVEYSLAAGAEFSTTFAEALLDPTYKESDLKYILERTFDAHFKWHKRSRSRLRSDHPFHFPWREQALDKIQQALAIEEGVFDADKLKSLISLISSVPKDWTRTFDVCHQARCHGDLNAGNLLIGVDRSKHLSPCLIDFTWVTDEFAPSLDYAKLERDIRVRCLRKLATGTGEYPEILQELDDALANDLSAKNHNPAQELSKCIWAINKIRTKFFDRFSTTEEHELAHIEYQFHLLCWMLAFFDTSEYDKLENDCQSQIIGSALRIHNSLNRQIAGIRSPVRSTTGPEEKFPIRVDIEHPPKLPPKRKWHAVLVNFWGNYKKPAITIGIMGIALAIGLMILSRLFHSTTSNSAASPSSPVSLPQQQKLPSLRTAIYVATIMGPEPDKFHINATLRDALNALAERYHDIEVSSFDRSIDEQNAKDIVESLKNDHVALLIWGRYEISESHILIHLHVETPSLLNPFISRQASLIYPKSQLLNFQVTEQELPKDINAIGMIIEGTALFMRGEFQQAENVIKEVLDHSPLKSSLYNNVSLKFILIMSQTQAAHYRESQRTIEQALLHSAELTASDARGLYALYAMTYVFIDPYSGVNICHKRLDSYLMSRSPEAEEVYPIALACSLVSYLSGDNNGGDAYRRKGLDTLSKMSPATADDHVELAMKYEQLCDPGASLNEYYKANEMSPGNSSVLMQIGRLMVRKGDILHANFYFDQAQKAHNSYLSMPNPGGVDVDLELRMLNATNTNANPSTRKSAIESLKKEIAAHQHNATLYHHLGELYEWDGNEAAALESYTTAIRLDPDNAYLSSTYSSRGRLFEKANRLAEAKENFSKAIALNSIASSFFEDRGLFFVKIRQLKRAEADLSKAVELETRFKDTHWCYVPPFQPGRFATLLWEHGMIQAKLGNLSGALQSAERAIKYDDGSVTAYELKGDILRKEQRFSDAANSYAQAINHMSNSAFFWDLDSFKRVSSDKKLESLTQKLKSSLHIVKKNPESVK